MTQTAERNVDIVEGKPVQSTLYKYNYDQSGKFIVAQGPLKKGTIVFEETGVCKSKPDKYTLQLNGEQHMLCSGPLIYCNHSCEPNCKAIVSYGTVAFEAIRNIDENELVTFDYNTTEWDMDSPFDCICGSENCKKRIAGFKNLTPEQQSQIRRDLMSPYIRQQADALLSQTSSS